MSGQLEHILGLIETLETAIKGATIDPSPPETMMHDFGKRCADWFIEHQTEIVSVEGRSRKIWAREKKRI